MAGSGFAILDSRAKCGKWYVVGAMWGWMFFPTYHLPPTTYLLHTLRFLARVATPPHSTFTVTFAVRVPVTALLVPVTTTV